MSVAAALTPLVKAAQPGCNRRWALNVSAYTLSGALSSALVGLTLGALGSALGVASIPAAGIMAAALVAIVAAARELGVSAIPLLQARRATPGEWARNLNGALVPALWGFDLGLCFTTYFTFAGPWLLVTLAVVAGSPIFGAALFLAYWAGRVLSVWLAPLLLPDASSTPQLVTTLVGAKRSFQLVHVAGLCAMAALLIAMLVTSREIW